MNQISLASDTSASEYIENIFEKYGHGGSLNKPLTGLSYTSSMKFSFEVLLASFSCYSTARSRLKRLVVNGPYLSFHQGSIDCIFGLRFVL